jgi:hypothetical protein
VLLAGLLALALALIGQPSSAAVAAAAPRPLVAGGDGHSCAVLSGGVKCWGGSVGVGAGGPDPVTVGGVGAAVAVTAGESQSCALTAAGSVKCWGGNVYGELGDGSTATRTTAVDVQALGVGVVSVAAGGRHTCAATPSKAWCWGRNDKGQVGDGTWGFDRHVPVPVVGLSGSLAQLAAGYEHTCALTTGGAVVCWGSGGDGQLGDTYTGGYFQPKPVQVVGLTSGVVSIAAGGAESCAVLSGGGVKCWGFNRSGQLGDGTIETRRDTPVDVVGLTGVAAVAVGGNHACALTQAGGVKCWGNNEFGQLGDGTTTERRAPVDVRGLQAGVTAIAAGTWHTCAETTSGVVKCWGRNYERQIGDGTTTMRLTPVDATGPRPRHTLFVTKTGTGSGTVQSFPAGITCGTTCSMTFDFGTSINLGASSAPRSIFQGWRGDCHGGSGTVCSVTMDVDRHIQAVFTITPLPCDVPNVVGTPLKTARRLIAARHCRVATVRSIPSRLKEGYVVAQRPMPGRAHLAPGAKISLTVSNGERRGR